MSDTATRIASRLEACFVERGFSAPGVDALKDASGVSLRTLYRYFPSREKMVIGALEHRHERYLSFLDGDAPPGGTSSIRHVFDRVENWMDQECGTGCLFLNALAAHPASRAIRDTVTRQKDETRALLGRRSGRPKLADALFLLHEGAVAAWPLMGRDAVHSARTSALRLIEHGPGR